VKIAEDGFVQTMFFFSLTGITQPELLADLRWPEHFSNNSKTECAHSGIEGRYIYP
jgi:hypothetical protein